MGNDERYARQKLIQWWDQEKLQAARVMVIGAGALGNEVLKNLALLGIGHLLVIDFDIIEPSNLSRTVLFQETDIKESKVEMAAQAVHRLNPAVHIETINGDIFYDVGLGHYRHSDLAIGCLDSLAARAQTGLGCTLGGIPFLDGGMWSLGGEVRWFMAGDGPCFDCTMGSEDRARADERRQCQGYRSMAWDASQQVATVISTSAIIGGILAQEAAKYLCGYEVLAGRALVYNGQRLSLHRTEFERDPNCPSSHTPYEGVIELPHRAAELTPRALLQIAREQANQRFDVPIPPGDDELAVELGRDFLIALDCPACGAHEDVNQVWGKVLENQQACPHCGTLRKAENVRSITASSPYADRSLAQLGVPPGEVLAIFGAPDLLLFELTGDLPRTGQQGVDDD